VRANPPADLAKWRASLAALSARIAALRDQLRPLDASVGSNNWVVSAAKSATGAAMVANDPHLSLQYPPLFHLAAMTSANPADNLDITGGSFPGVPGALVGRGARVGWGVTVVGYDVTDVYKEQFVPCQSATPCVLFKGAPVATIPYAPAFKVRVGAGSAGLVAAAGTPAVLLVVPHHGPVIQAPDSGGHGLSVRWTGHEGTTQDSKAFYGLNTATNVDAAMAALNDYATGAQNFVLADDQGNIAYYPHALVPVRKFADPVATAGHPIPPWFPLPGDGSAEWGDGVSDCASPTAGQNPACWVANQDLPQGKNPAKGYFFTANADPTSLASDPEKGVSDDNNPLLHPPYLSFDWDDSSGFRATRIEQMMKDTLAANGGKVSVADMMKIQSDHVSRFGLAFAPILAAIPTTGAPAELGLAKQILATWIASGADCPSGLTGSDPKASAVDTTAAVVQSSTGCFLFHEFLRVLIGNVFTDDLALAKQSIGTLAAVKAMLFMLGLDPTAPDTPAATAFCNDVDSASGSVVAPKSCGVQVAAA